MIAPPCIYGGSLKYEYEYYDMIPIYDLHSHIINAHRMCSPPSLKKNQNLLERWSTILPKDFQRPGQSLFKTHWMSLDCMWQDFFSFSFLPVCKYKLFCHFMIYLSLGGTTNYSQCISPTDTIYMLLCFLIHFYSQEWCMHLIIFAVSSSPLRILQLKDK